MAETLAVPSAPTAVRGVTHPDESAYVLFTSGTSGTPKAVEVTHGNLAHLLHGLETTVWHGLGHARVAWNASASFDASVQQWLRLCRGTPSSSWTRRPGSIPWRWCATWRDTR